MKLEIKLNQEQFDLLITSLVQIAQGCVRMADSKEEKGVVVSVSERGGESKVFSKRVTKFPGYISYDAIYNKVGGGISARMFKDVCRKRNITPKKLGANNRLYIKREFADAIYLDLYKMTHEE